MKSQLVTFIRKSLEIGILIAATCTVQNVSAQALPEICGTLSNHFGPYDYRPKNFKPFGQFHTHNDLLYIVENAHFTPQVESLVRGKTATHPGPDLNYTLNVFPNHHRALLAMIAYAERTKSDPPPQMTYSVTCRLQRAITFRPDDQVARLIYAAYLGKKGEIARAEAQLETVSNNPESTAFTFQNIGLIYFDMKNYDKSRMFAYKAIALGLANSILKDLLIKADQWVEPQPGAS